MLLDGRGAKVPKYESGSFLKPTLLDGLPADSELTDTEIFGPVLSLVHADMDEALAFLERSPYGNQASLFTSSGAAARRFRYEAPAGNIGINIGVAAPMAYFPFSGWKDSFFGICMRRAAMLSSSIPTRKSWWSAGWRRTRGSFELPKLRSRQSRGMKKQIASSWV